MSLINKRTAQLAGYKLLPHNQQAFNKVMQSFSSGNNRVAIVHATGTGKTFVAIKWIQTLIEGGAYLDADQSKSFKGDKSRKVLYVLQKLVMQQQIERYLKESGQTELLKHIKFITYSKLLYDLAKAEDSGKGEKFANKYTHIVLDEFHHADENSWGSAVERLLSLNPTAQVLGLTATPVRSSGKDASKSLFKGNVVSTLSLEEAMTQGILPVPDYYTAVYSYDALLSKFKKMVSEFDDKSLMQSFTRRIDEIKTKIEQADGFKEIIINHLSKKPNGKYVFFCDSIASAEKYKREILSLFKGKIKVACAYSVNYENDNAQAELAHFQEIENEGLKLLFAVNMLNEGVSINNLDGVVMLRSTDMFVIYEHQLGCALGSAVKTKPLVLDLVNNIDSVFGYVNGNNQIRNMFTRIAKNKPKEKYIQDITLRLKENNDILTELKKLEEDIGRISTKLRIEIVKEVAKKEDLNSLLTTYCYTYKGKEYHVGRWLQTARNNKCEPELLQVLLSLGFKPAETKGIIRVEGEDKIEILQAMFDIKELDLDNEEEMTRLKNGINSIEKEEEFYYKGKSYKVGRWLEKAKLGYGGETFINWLETVGYRLQKERTHVFINEEVKIKIIKHLVSIGIDLNAITRDMGFEFSEQENPVASFGYPAGFVFPVGNWLFSARRGIGGAKFIALLKESGFDLQKPIKKALSVETKLNIVKNFLGVDKNGKVIRDINTVKKSETCMFEGSSYAVGQRIFDARRGKGEPSFIQGLIEMGLKVKTENVGV